MTARVVRQSVNSTIVQWQQPDGTWSAAERRYPERGATAEIGGQEVKKSMSPWDDESASKNYLVDAIALRQAYRKTFLRGLKSLYRRGKLSLAGSRVRSPHLWFPTSTFPPSLPPLPHLSCLSCLSFVRLGFMVAFQAGAWFGAMKSLFS